MIASSHLILSPDFTRTLWKGQEPSLGLRKVVASEENFLDRRGPCCKAVLPIG